MTRADALQHVVNILNELPLDDIQRTALRRAIVGYGSAAATEAIEGCKALIEECLTSAH